MKMMQLVLSLPYSKLH